MPKLDFIFFDAGGGHRAAATALRQACSEQYPDWEIRLVNLQDVMDSLDIFRQTTGVRMQDMYNLILRKGWTLGSSQMLVAMHGMIRLYHPMQVRKLKAFWRRGAPDLVVSLIPNFNRPIFEALARVSPHTKLITILTDLADYPPHFWMEKQHQYFVCGTDQAERQALDLGHPPSRIFRASGMILHPRFYQPQTFEVPAERAKLGLRSDLPTALLLFGGYGSVTMARIAQRLDSSGLPLQLIFICGKNEKLKRLITSLNLRMPHFIEGFTSQIPYYMKLSDFFIGKPGPGSISEAIQMGLPVIVTRNSLTLPQERYNADWVLEKNLGLVLKSFKHIASAVEELLSGNQLERFRARASAIQNRAVFEIPQMLHQVLQNSGNTHPTA
jgi:hypothetical protein